ncbi:unnamed protein product [Discula destructiva]
MLISKGTESQVSQGCSKSPPSLSSREQEYGDDLSAHLKSAHKKVDVRLILWYAFVCLFMRIHVSNTSNTAIINLEQADGIKEQPGKLSSQQWAWVLAQHILLPVPVLRAYGDTGAEEVWTEEVDVEDHDLLGALFTDLETGGLTDLNVE